MSGPKLKPLPRRSGSVCEDWVAHLPAQQNEVFDATTEYLETSYNMMSVSLNDAFTLRSSGQLSQAREGAGVTADLFDRLARQLQRLIGSLREQGSNLFTLPNVVALTPENFRGSTAHRVARTSSILSKILFSVRSIFFRKLDALSKISGDLAFEFRETAEDVATGISVQPSVDWEVLDTVHYDMNTCLRESIIVFKSFLLVLPDGELRAFQQRLTGGPRQLTSPVPAPVPAFRHRRVTAI